MPKKFDPINVDFLINSKQVKLAAASVKKDIKGTDQTAQDSAQKTSAVINKAYAQNAKAVQQYGKAVAATTGMQGRSLQAGKRYFDGLSHSMNQITREMPAFAVSAQVGFLALSNNIPILVDEITKLKKVNAELVASGQKGVPVWKQVTRSMLSWGTALSIGVTLLTIFGHKMVPWIQSLFKGRGAIDEARMSQEAFNDALKSTEYKDGQEQVMKLGNAFKLVKEGAMSGDEALNLYNDTMGKVVGTADDLNQAEQLYIDNSDKYVQALLYRQAAQITASETASKIVEYQREEQELQQDYEKELASSKALINRLNQGAGSANEDALRESASKRVTAARKAINELRKERSEYIKSSNELYQQFKRKELSFGFNFDTSESGGGGDSIIRQRQSLLDKIAALDREYARKNLESDEAELQALRDKFDRVRKLIERFNKSNPKAAIALGDLTDIQERSETELLARQKEEREAEMRKVIEKNRRAWSEAYGKQQEQWQQTLDGLRNYNDQRLKLIADYEELRAELVAKGHDKEAEQLDEYHQADLDALDDANVEKLEAYKKLFKNVANLTRAEIKTVLSQAKTLLAELDMSAEMRSKIIEEITKLQEDLEDATLDDISMLSNAIGDLAGSFAELGNSLNSPGMSDAGNLLAGLAGGMDNLLTALDSTSSKADVISAGIGGLVQIIDMIATSAKNRKDAETAYYMAMIGLQHEYNLGLNEQMRLQGELAESAFLTDYESKITDGITALADANSEYSNAIAQLQDGLVQTGQRNAINWGSVGAGAGGGAAVGAAVGSVVPVIGTAIGAVVGGLAGALTGLFAGKKKEAEWGSLLEEYPELIYQTEDGVTRVNKALAESLLASGLLNEETAQILQNVLDWDEALEQAREQIKSVIQDLAGGLSADLRNALVEAFVAGEDAAKAMGDTVENVLEGILSQLIFNEIFSSAFDQLEDEMAASYGEGGDGSWVDDFSRFFTDASAMTDDFNQAMEDAKNEAKGFGFDIFDGSGSGASALAGAIRRELTEQTASELAGLYRAQFDLSKRHFHLAEQALVFDQQNTEFTNRIMQTNLLIEANTAATVAELKMAVTALQQINRNTKQNSTGYDRGR